MSPRFGHYYLDNTRKNVDDNFGKRICNFRSLHHNPSGIQIDRTSSTHRTDCTDRNVEQLQKR